MSAFLLRGRLLPLSNTLCLLLWIVRGWKNLSFRLHNGFLYCSEDIRTTSLEFVLCCSVVFPNLSEDLSSLFSFIIVIDSSIGCLTDTHFWYLMQPRLGALSVPCFLEGITLFVCTLKRGSLHLSTWYLFLVKFLQKRCLIELFKKLLMLKLTPVLNKNYTYSIFIIFCL